MYVGGVTVVTIQHGLLAGPRHNTELHSGKMLWLRKESSLGSK